jgi:hypothetical protein
MQPTRRGYFVFLFKIDPTLQNGIYEIPFTISGTKRHYSGTDQGSVSYTVPDAMFCITDKDANGNISEYQKIILDNSVLKTLEVTATGNFVPTGRIKWSTTNFGQEDFESISGTLTSDANGNINLASVTSFPTIDTTQLVIMQEGTVDSYNTTAEILRLTDGQTLNYTNTSGDQEIVSERLMVKPVGPRIQVKNKVYSINGVLVTDTIVYEPEEDIYVETMLTAKNTGSDISSNTLVNIFPGLYYDVVEDSLEANCTLNGGLISVNFEEIIPGEMKQQLLPFMLHPAELPEGIDIRLLIQQSEIDYEGTLVNDKVFHFMDTNKLLLDLYDFETTSLSYNNLGNGQVQVNATAGNRGIYGKDVWFRIYPIIGDDGTYEFPIAEIRVENFQPGQRIELDSIYTLPITDKPIDFIAIIDDGLDYVEITELNNIIRVDFEVSGMENPESINNAITIYPSPFVDDVNFEYSLDKDYITITINVFDLKGRQWLELKDCPATAGINTIKWRCTDMPEGSYIYQLTGENMNGASTVLFTGQIIKLVQ